MSFQVNYPPLDPIALQKRIKEIKVKNNALSQKFRSKISDSNVNKSKKPEKRRKYDFFDKNEVLAVEKCHEKATKLAELCLILKREKRKSSVKLKTFNDINKYYVPDSIVPCVAVCLEPNNTRKRINYQSKSVSIIPGVDFSTNSLDTVEKQHCVERKMDRNIANNNRKEIIKILDEDDNIPKNRYKKRRRKKVRQKCGMKNTLSECFKTQEVNSRIVSEGSITDSFEIIKSPDKHNENQSKENSLYIKEMSQNSGETSKKIDPNKESKSERILDSSISIAKNNHNLENVDYLKSNNCSYDKESTNSSSCKDIVNSVIGANRKCFNYECNNFKNKKKKSAKFFKRSATTNHSEKTSCMAHNSVIDLESDNSSEEIVFITDKTFCDYSSQCIPKPPSNCTSRLMNNSLKKPRRGTVENEAKTAENCICDLSNNAIGQLPNGEMAHNSVIDLERDDSSDEIIITDETCSDYSSQQIPNHCTARLLNNSLKKSRRRTVENESRTAQNLNHDFSNAIGQLPNFEMAPNSVIDLESDNSSDEIIIISDETCNDYPCQNIPNPPKNCTSGLMNNCLSVEKFRHEAGTGQNFINDFVNNAEHAIERIIPKLDLTEEPVDFPVPLLHSDESITVSREKLEFLKSKGIVIKSGKFSDEEHAFLRRNFRDFQTRFGINDICLLLGIGRRLPFNKQSFNKIKKFLQSKHFYVRLGKDINQRTLKMIYYRARLLFSPFRRRKRNAEEVTHVFELQKKYGNNWNLIGHILNLDPLDCRNIYRYRKHTANS